VSWAVEPLRSLDEIDAILVVERASFTNPWTREMYLAELDHDGVAFFFVARNPEGQIVGFCSYWRILDEFHINNLAVLPDYRRQGIASALLARVLAEGAVVGIRRATLEVRRSNDSARRLYERFGFATIGVRRAYYTSPVEDAIVLSREDLTTG
jgi:ribosomal-protein-alanine N-acetyltransferase